MFRKIIINLDNRETLSMSHPKSKRNYYYMLLKHALNFYYKDASKSKFIRLLLVQKIKRDNYFIHK